MYLTSHLTAEKTSTKLKSKDELDAILIPADASAEMLKKSLEDIEDLWPKVEGLVQTVILAPGGACQSKYSFVSGLRQLAHARVRRASTHRGGMGEG